MAKKIYTDHRILPKDLTEQADIETSDDNEVLSCFTDKDSNKFFVIKSSITKKYNYPDVHFVLHRTAGPAVTKDLVDEYWFQGKKFETKEAWELYKKNIK